MPKTINKFDCFKYGDKEYLYREIVYTDKYGTKHSCIIADSTLSDVLLTKNGAFKDSQADYIDSKIYCYAPVSVLLIEDDQELAQWLEDYVTEMELDRTSLLNDFNPGELIKYRTAGMIGYCYGVVSEDKKKLYPIQSLQGPIDAINIVAVERQ